METSRRGRKRAGILLAGAAVAAFAGLLLSSSGPFRSVSGRASSASEANARLWNCHVPPDATDVWFISSYRFTRVECTLKPESFEDWCHRRGWRPTPIDESASVPEWVTSQRDGMKTITRGHRFNAMNGDRGYTGLYDAEGQRAYVTYSGS